MAGNANSGNRSDAQKKRSVQVILEGTAKEAADLLDKYVRKVRGYTQMSPEKLRACFFVVDHAVGKARQKIEHSGGVMTYGQLVKSAEQQVAASPELLIDVDKLPKN